MNETRKVVLPSGVEVDIYEALHMSGAAQTRYLNDLEKTIDENEKVESRKATRNVHSCVFRHFIKSWTALTQGTHEDLPIPTKENDTVLGEDFDVGDARALWDECEKEWGWLNPTYVPTSETEDENPLVADTTESSS